MLLFDLQDIVNYRHGVYRAAGLCRGFHREWTTKSSLSERCSMRCFAD
jgi:hypothetical protein